MTPNNSQAAVAVAAAVAARAKDFEIPDEPGAFEELAQALVADNHPFWDAHSTLKHLRDFARARMAGPWGVLGVALARVVAATEPGVVLPATVGTTVSLNLFVGLVAPSGGGKGAAEGAAADALRFTGYNNQPVEVDTLPVGSGEGLSRAFRPAGSNPDEPADRTRALFTSPEVDTMAALGSRQGSTLMPQLRSLYMGESIGFQNGAKSSTSVLPRQSYRACLVVGVQPAKAGALLADADGGTPQRFLWLPVTDPDAPDSPPGCPDPVEVKIPQRDEPLKIPKAAEQAIRRHRLSALRSVEGVNPLDGHALLCRLKVAAALMLLLDGGAKAEVTEDHWALAGHVMAVSDRTRARVERAIADKARAVNRARAHADAERAVIVKDKVHQSDAERASRYIVDKLGRVGSASESELSTAVPGTLRAEWFGSVFTELRESGRIVPTGRNRKGNDVFSLA